MDFTFSKQLNYLIHRVDGENVAHCLDLDLVGSGDSVSDAIAELNTAVRALVFFALKTQTFDISSLCKRAPDDYWDMFEEAKPWAEVPENNRKLMTAVCAEILAVPAVAGRTQGELERESAISFMPDYQAIGAELNVRWGDSVHDKILPGIKALKAELAALRESASPDVCKYCRENKGPKQGGVFCNCRCHNWPQEVCSTWPHPEQNVRRESAREAPSGEIVKKIKTVRGMVARKIPPIRL